MTYRTLPHDENASRLVHWLKHRSPAQLIALSFISVIIIGAFLLALPPAHASGHRVGLLDALFTATSAVCVTGLAVVDTATVWSRFGQVVILLLIQVGGFGIITIGMLLALASRRRLGVRERINLQTQINSPDVGSVERVILIMFILVLLAELIGASLMLLRFRQVEPDYSFFYAFFHSVSAFNNAGFALYSDSLSQFVGDPLINLTIIGLILIGGLGVIVIIDLFRHVWPHRRFLYSLHTKMALTSTAILIAIGFSAVLLIEWSNPATLGQLPFGHKMLAALFQGITPRTAGFNTLDYGAMRGGTQVVTLLLMFIGGNPGSTAGGLKTVTFFVLIGSAWSVSRGNVDVVFFGRRLARELIIRATVIAFLYLMVGFCALVLLTITEYHLAPFALLFETVSAMGTVGISLGITPDLSFAGKLIIIALMYLGRLGALTLAIALIERRSDYPIRYPAEDVLIG